jgi:hypothetical protein
MPIGADALTQIASTAARNKKSISTTGVYAERFHAELIKVTAVEKLIVPVINAIAGFDSGPLLRHLEAVKSTTAIRRGA